MNSIMTVTKFTIKDMLHRKSYIISTIIILVLIVVGFNIPNLIKHFSSNLDDTKQKVAIIDEDNVFENNLELLNSFGLNYELVLNKYNEDDVKKDIEDEVIDGAILINKNENDINLDYIVNDISVFYTSPDDLINSISSLYKNLELNKLELTEEELARLNPTINYNVVQLGNNNEINSVIMMLSSIILFYAVYFCAYQVSSSITTEKTSKIIETLVTSTSPRNIVLGKTLGIGLVGIGQVLLIILTALISANLFLDHETLNVILDVSNINIGIGIIALVYFILGYLVYALLYALTGSTASKPEDIQSVNTPVSLLAVFGFYIAYFTSLNPASGLNTFAAIFPLSSPFCMPLRIMMGLASLKEVIISIVLLLSAILIIANIAIKIYSNAILNYGTKLSIKDLIQLYKMK